MTAITVVFPNAPYGTLHHCELTIPINFEVLPFHKTRCANIFRIPGAATYGRMFLTGRIESDCGGIANIPTSQHPNVSAGRPGS
jgi:hypothetical protein